MENPVLEKKGGDHMSEEEEKKQKDEINNVKDNDGARYIRGLFEQLEIKVFAHYGDHLKKAIKAAGGDAGKFSDIMIRNKRKYMSGISYIVNRFIIFIADNTAGLINKTYKGHAITTSLKFGGTNEKKVNAITDELGKGLISVKQSILRQQEDIYRQTTFSAVQEYGAGHMTLEQAVQDTAQKFAAKGITSITYKGGRKVNIASYAEMAIRTANHRAALYGGGEVRKKYGNYLVRVSQHAITCDQCRPWQGKILIDDVFSGPVPDEAIEQYKGKYPRLSQAIEAGLLHPNCRHNIVTYYEGMTAEPESKTSDEESQKMYEAEQAQRAMERQIRKLKRELATAMTDKKQKEIKASIRDEQKALRDHLEKNTFLRRARWREQLYLE